jgi:hypothetical protein
LNERVITGIDLEVSGGGPILRYYPNIYMETEVNHKPVSLAEI